MMARRWLLGILLGLALLQWAMPWKVGIVWGHSMTPILRDKQVILIGRHVDAGGLHKGDIVSFRRNGGTYIKAVYGLPGDVITEFYTDDRTHALLLDRNTERKVRLTIRNRITREGRIVHIRVPEGYVYVVGSDTSSNDSRSFGPIPVKDITGTVRTARRPESVLKEVTALCRI
ncbi:MAG: signal peptidase I [Armatimonadetes bacterium]|nr:signal peptidase I [Armatimonadota bacterium]